MAVTGVRVFLHNDTDQALTLTSSEVPDGDWTIAPPGRIEPRSVAMAGSESDGLNPDTQGRATYRIGDDDTQSVYVHWNDPLVGSNSFHTDTDDGHYAFWTASPGRHPEVHFTVRDAGVVMTDFLPSRDGFRFTNRWDNDTPYALPPLRDSVLNQKYGNAKNGLCGGMVLAARDYFESGWRIPGTTTPPLGEQDALFVYLVDRLFDTFSVDSVSLMLALMNPAYPDGDENMLTHLGLAHGRAAVMAHEEWPLLRADIDSGHPSPLCLIAVCSTWPGDLGVNHQVLAYGYEVHGHEVVLHVYDPNTPDRPQCDAVRLSFNDGDVSRRIMVTHNVDLLDDDDHQLPIYCFARMDYEHREPTLFEGQRLPGDEIARRGISVVEGEMAITSSQETSSGRRAFDVWPDCGEHDFTFHELVQSQRLVIAGRVHGYYSPKVVWRVGGTLVPPGNDSDLTVNVVPDDHATPGRVTLHVRLDGDVLAIDTASHGYNFSVLVDVRVRELDMDSDEAAGDKDVGKSWSVEPSFVGRRVQVDGLGEAMAECMRNYLDARRDGLPDAEAAFAATYAQLRRPTDPLWDPDPVMLDAASLLIAADPSVAEIAQDVQLSATQVASFHLELSQADAATDAVRAAATAAEARVEQERLEALRLQALRAEEARLAALKAAQLKDKTIQDLQAEIAGQLKDIQGLGGP